MKKSKLSKEEFLQILSTSDMDISKKSDKYHKEECRISADYFDNMQKGNSENASLEYLELASTVKKDFLNVGDFLKKNIYALTGNQIDILNLIIRWSKVKMHSYKYYSNYLVSEDSEDDNESKRLKEEAESLVEEFLKLISNL